MDAVLFDMFGVIARNQGPEGRAAIERAAGFSGHGFWDAYWSARPGYDRGDLTGPEYWHAVAGRLGASFDGRQTEELVRLDLASWNRFDEEMVEFVAALAADGVPLGLLSNIPRELAGLFTEEHSRVMDLFSVLGLSCRLGAVKPEPEAYRWCLSGLGMPADRVLFVDDSEKNIVAARELGLQAHHFTSLPELRGALGRVP